MLIRPVTRDKQMHKHPDLDAEFYAQMPEMLASYKVALRDGLSDTILVVDRNDKRYMIVLTRNADRKLYLKSAYRLSKAKEAKLRMLPIIEGSW